MADFSPDAVEMRGTPRRDDQTVPVIERLGEAEPFLSVDDRLVERSTLGQGPRQPGPGHHGGKPGQLVAVTTPIAAEQVHDLLKEGHRLSIVAGGEADCAEVVIRPNLEREISERLSDGLGVLGGRTRFSCVASAPEIVTLVERYPPESQLIPERLSEALGFAQMRGEPLEIAKREERGSKVEAQIDGLLERLAGLGQMLEGHQRLLEVSDRFSIRRSRERPSSGLTEVGRGLLPRLAPEGVVGKPLDVLGQPVRIGSFDGADDASVQGLAPVLE
jgi:hypothetical protein